LCGLAQLPEGVKPARLLGAFRPQIERATVAAGGSGVLQPLGDLSMRRRALRPGTAS